MKLQLNVTPLYGAQTDDHAICTLLSLDGLNILLDCGWNSTYDPSFLTNLAAVAPTVHAVLLSHPDTAHLGALPYASAKLGLTAPIYSTLPVWRMGQMFMYDAYLSHDAQQPFHHFDLDDVDALFDYSPGHGKVPRFTLLKYHQSIALDGLTSGATDVVVTPHRAGHMIGGTVWHISKGTASIVYAVHVNHRKDRHLSPTTLASFSRPSHLLLSATNALHGTASANLGEDLLFRTVRRTVKRGGNVLIPTDTAGRIIELAVILDSLWESDSSLRDSNAQLVVLHALAKGMFEFARSMIEWASDEFMTAFDVTRKNMFQCKHLRILTDISGLDTMQGPFVVLASSPSLNYGPARQLFGRWATDSRNSVVLVNRKEPGTLAAKLHEHVQKASEAANGSSKQTSVTGKSQQDATVRAPKGKASQEKSEAGTVGKNEASPEIPLLELDLVMGKKVPLQGEELEQWRERERTKKRLEAEERRKEEEDAQKQEEEQKRLEERAKRMEEDKLGDGTATESGHLTEIIGSGRAEAGANGSVGADGNMEKRDAEMEEVEDNGEKAAREYDEDLLDRLRDLGVLATKRSDAFEYDQPEEYEWDEYGKKIDTARFIIGEDPGDGGLFDEADRKPEKEKSEEEEEEIVPMKHISEEVKVKVDCELVFADCSGISDGDSLRHLVKEVEPRHVTITSGTQSEVKALEQSLRKALSATSVIVTPGIKETVKMVSDVSVYNLSLDDTLVKTVAWKKVGLARIGFVDGCMSADVDSKGLGILGMRKTDPNEADKMEEMDLVDVHDKDSSKDQDELEGHGTYFVGTIMLNKLKDGMAQAGLKAEFAGGALCVENPKTGAVVIVKKIGGQHISLQGSLCEEYFTVQDLLYKQVVIPR